MWPTLVNRLRDIVLVVQMSALDHRQTKTSGALTAGVSRLVGEKVSNFSVDPNDRLLQVSEPSWVGKVQTREHLDSISRNDQKRGPDNSSKLQLARKSLHSLPSLLVSFVITVIRLSLTLSGARN